MDPIISQVFSCWLFFLKNVLEMLGINIPSNARIGIVRWVQSTSINQSNL